LQVNLEQKVRLVQMVLVQILVKTVNQEMLVIQV
jgi:hypothetical protein